MEPNSPRLDPDPDPDDEPPVEQLAGLEVAVSPELAQRVIATIQRRQAAGHFATLHWLGLGAVLAEFARLGLPKDSKPQPPGE